MHGFISIRWKVIATAAAVLAVMAGVFSWQQQRALSAQFSADQAANQAYLQALAERLFQVQSNRLQVLARMLAESPAMRAALQAGDAAAVRRALDANWPELNLGQGLTGMSVFNAAHQPLAAWGDVPAAGLERLASEAVLREMPKVWVTCGMSACVHQVVLPLAQHGKPIGSMALIAGFEDLVLDLRRLGNAEIGILHAPMRSISMLARANPLSGLRLLSMSGDERIHAVLRKAMMSPWDTSYHLASQADVSASVLVLRPELPGDGGLRLVAVADVSQSLRRQGAAVRHTLLWGAGVLLGSVLLLYGLLRPTMNRIQRVARLLPLLGEERFDEVRRGAAVGQPLVADEMHRLIQLAGELAVSLQTLQQADEAHARRLTEQAKQLETERDFISRVLDTAPVLILTYGRDDRIRMANALAAEDTLSTREALVGQSFCERFLSPAKAHEHPRMLATLRPGEVRHGESHFMRPSVITALGEETGGERRDVVWFHSCLDDGRGERTFLSVGLDVTEHRQAEQRLQLLVERDAVTGLLNRRTFKRELEAVLEHGAKGTLLVCDLDEFRALNDAEGHESGDRVLALFAQHLQRLEPAATLSARLGSDEFVLVFVGLAEADGILMARHLSRFVLDHAAPRANGASRKHVSVSVGLVAFPAHGDSADVLLGNAELALTHARAQGHGSWHLYSEQGAYRESADRRAHWREEVEVALEENRYVLHFQPILDIAGGGLSHYEALLRMVGRDGKLIPPGAFIDVAESTGLIRRIDRWVINATVAAAAAHREAKIALNLSSRSFDDDIAFETMRDALARHHVAGERLLLEITETAALANFSGAKRIMERFQGLGCVFGLDDFGVGYSSFQYLRELPVGFVKIDGSFIKNLTRNPDDVVFVRALNSAVRGFGKTTVAEFVEDEATLDILREIGVDYAQGYLIGKPAAEMLKAA